MSKPTVGSRVRHWYCASGEVLRVIGVVCYVRWDRGGEGWAWTNHCKVDDAGSFIKSRNELVVQLQQDVARYENGRVVMVGEITRLKRELLAALEQRNAEVRLRQAAERATLEPCARQPDGYAYRYHGAGGDFLDFGSGYLINGGKPFESVPYYLGTPPASAQPPGADVQRLAREALPYVNYRIRSLADSGLKSPVVEEFRDELLKLAKASEARVPGTN